jgi:hypothetical protein
MDMDDADARHYVPNKDYISGNWVEWRTKLEDEDMDNEDVENLLQLDEEIAESSNVPSSNEDVDDLDMRSEDRGITAAQKGKQKMVRMA